MQLLLVKCKKKNKNKNKTVISTLKMTRIEHEETLSSNNHLNIAHTRNITKAAQLIKNMHWKTRPVISHKIITIKAVIVQSGKKNIF